MDYASHKHAIKFICGYSFLEAIIMPIPIDVFLGPVAMQHPQKWLRLSVYTAIFSILGGCIGYTLGYFISGYAHQFLNFISNEQVFLQIKNYLDQYGSIIVILVGFTPLPFKIFSIVFGIVKLNLVTFLVLSFISRLVRFVIVSYLFAVYGNKYSKQIENIVTRSGWYILLACILFFVLYKLFS